MSREKGPTWWEGAAVASGCAIGLQYWMAGEDRLRLLPAAAGLLLWFAVRLSGWLYLSHRSKSRSVSLVGAASPPSEARKNDDNMPSLTQTQHLIAKRRSIYPRDFTGQRVSKETIQAMLEAANWAPTHGVTEPWRFVVLEGAGKAMFEDITVEATRKLPEEEREKKLKKVLMSRESKWPKVSHYIVACMKRQPKPNKLNPEWEEMCAVAAAVQNMLLMATSAGVACYWSSWSKHSLDYPQMREFLGLGEEDKCLGVLVVGHSDHIAGYRGSRSPVEEKVKWLE